MFKHKEVKVAIPRGAAIPKPGCEQDERSVADKFGIVNGSAIASLSLDETVKVYYEGNVYGAVNLHDYTQRLYCAAGRALTSAPTTAFIVLSRDEYERNFYEVGTVSVIAEKMAVTYSNEIAVKNWAQRYERN